MRRALILLTAAAIILVFAGLSSVFAVVNVTDDIVGIKQASNRIQKSENKEPSWDFLRRMSNEEKANAVIQIELGQNADPMINSAVTQVENLWNNGQYQSAITEFENLAELYGSNSFAIGVGWRNPVPTYETALWGTDVRIGNRDSIYINCFDIHRASGHLFAILTYLEGGSGYWSVNLSTDGGASWNETYVWFAGSGEQASLVSMTVLTDECYVAYRTSDSPYTARLRRFWASNGNSNGTYSAVYTTVAPDTIKEVVINSNQDSFNNRLYYWGISKNGNLRLFWSLPEASSWTELATGVTNAERGLDATYNEGFATRFLWVSYFNSLDTLKIDYVALGDIYGNATRLYVGSALMHTSIGAYCDTLICFHEMPGSSIYFCRYEVSYNGGSSWYYGTVDDTVTNFSYYPDVTARKGGGFGVVYRYYSPTRELRFVHRGYAVVPSWSTPVSIADNEPNTSIPAIEYLGGGFYGTVYTSWLSPYREAYFDRNNPPCEYLPGDINGDGTRIGGDVTYGVRYFKGVGGPPPDSCYMDSTHTYLYVAGDVNGNCEFRGSDITRLVSFFKGTAVLSTCHFFPGPLLRDENHSEPTVEIMER
jgi:hypothetical protein